MKACLMMRALMMNVGRIIKDGSMSVPHECGAHHHQGTHHQGTIIKARIIKAHSQSSRSLSLMMNVGRIIKDAVMSVPRLLIKDAVMRAPDESVCVCVYVCVCTHMQINTHTHTLPDECGARRHMIVSSRHSSSRHNH